MKVGVSISVPHAIQSKGMFNLLTVVATYCTCNVVLRSMRLYRVLSGLACQRTAKNRNKNKSGQFGLAVDQKKAGVKSGVKCNFC